MRVKAVLFLYALLVIIIISWNAYAVDVGEVDGCKLCCDHQFRGHCKCCSPQQLEELAILGGGGASSRVDVGEVGPASAGGGGGCSKKCCSRSGQCGCCSPHQLEELATQGGGGRGGVRKGGGGI